MKELFVGCVLDICPTCHQPVVYLQHICLVIFKFIHSKTFTNFPLYPQNSLERIFSLLSHTKEDWFRSLAISVTHQSQDCMGKGTGYAIKWWADGVRSSTSCLGLIHLKFISLSQSQDSLNYIPKWKTNAIHVMALLAILVIHFFLCLNLHGFWLTALASLLAIYHVPFHWKSVGCPSISEWL